MGGNILIPRALPGAMISQAFSLFFKSGGVTGVAQGYDISGFQPVFFKPERFT